MLPLELFFCSFLRKYCFFRKNLKRGYGIDCVVRGREYVCLVLGGLLKFVEGGRMSYLQHGAERKISYVDDFIFKDRSIHGPFLDFIAFSSGVVVL